MPSNSPEMTNLKVTETSNFNQASSTILEEDPYIKRGNKSIHTETGKHLNNALQSPTQSPRMTRFLKTLPLGSSTELWLITCQLFDLLRLESTLATLREIYQVRGLGDIPGIVDGQISQVQSDCNSLEIPNLLELLPSDLVATCQNPLTECLPTRASTQTARIHLSPDGIDPCGNTQKEGRDEEAYKTGWRNRNSFSSGGFRAVKWLRRMFESNVSPNLICSYRSLSQPSNLTPGDGEDLLPAVAGFGDLFAPGADNNAL
ncbi:hypothetical protein PPACK8108_LOCUS3356 [Phakopsora pachyrhizi]|uniref:Uncharacterized protein n=1 Tax=Phakopsora pachyrhizi TaxID=170000 RepID=A0AAV0AJW8_PHAPC|nr:hypothetical protein PPACK8108_LOCUS3356 [Phakopsora pachyrhizi]